MLDLHHPLAASYIISALFSNLKNLADIGPFSNSTLHKHISLGLVIHILYFTGESSFQPVKSKYLLPDAYFSVFKYKDFFSVQII